ncbi:MAG: L-seryl-tRNA(Sec) selenium transferase, partial [Neofamilia sp.]
VGGGAYPTEVLKSRAIAINPKTNADELEEFLRLSKYHIISNVENERILLDVRTILEDEFEKIIEILKEYYEN